MRKRTSPLLVLFLAGCPKSEEPKAEIFRFQGETQLSPRKRTASVELMTPGGARLSPRSVRVKKAAETELSIALAAPSPPGARLSVLLPRTAKIHRLAARVNGEWREASREPTERADFPVIPVVQAEPRFAPVLPVGTEEVIIAYAATSTIVDRAPPSGPPRKIDSLAVVIDASASSAKDWDRRVDLVRALIEALGRGSGGTIDVHVGVFDQSPQRLYDGQIQFLTPELWEKLHRWRGLGASNYGQMLAAVATGEKTGMFARKYSRLVLVGDGIATAGARSLPALSEGATHLLELGVRRVDVIAMGDVRNEALLSVLVRSGTEPGVVIDGELPPIEIGRLLAGAAIPVEAAPVETSSKAPSFFARRGARSGETIAANKPQLKTVPAPKRAMEQLEAAYSAIDAAPFYAFPLIEAGEIHAANNQAANAARVFGSLIDLYPAEPEMLQLAATRLEALRDESALKLSIDAFDKAAVMSPDRPLSHRMLAISLLKAHDEALAFAVLERAIKILPPGPAQRILREDASLVASAWVRREPNRRSEIGGRLAALGVTFNNRPEVIFALTWNGDVDVDLVVYDSNQAVIPSAGADDGMDILVVRGQPRKRSYPYRAEAHVYGRAAIGVTAGKLEIVEHDGNGGLWFVGRTFLLEEENGVVDLGNVTQAFGKGRGGS